MRGHLQQHHLLVTVCQHCTYCFHLFHLLMHVTSTFCSCCRVLYEYKYIVRFQFVRTEIRTYRFLEHAQSATTIPLYRRGGSRWPFFWCYIGSLLCILTWFAISFNALKNSQSKPFLFSRISLSSRHTLKYQVGYDQWWRFKLKVS